MPTDMRIRTEVTEELAGDPTLTVEGIGVAVSNGVVTLSGHVPSYFQTHAATRAAQRVRGVKAVASDLVVRLPSNQKRNDDEIAGRALDILKWSLNDASDIKIIVEDGHVTLSGAVDWRFQREQAERAIRMLGGVTGVVNAITIRPRVQARAIKVGIEDAFQRNACLEGGNICVSVEGATVTLMGTVKAWYERKMAEDVAWAMPGVNDVIDHITVR